MQLLCWRSYTVNPTSPFSAGRSGTLAFRWALMPIVTVNCPVTSSLTTRKESTSFWTTPKRKCLWYFRHSAKAFLCRVRMWPHSLNLRIGFFAPICTRGQTIQEKVKEKKFFLFVSFNWCFKFFTLGTCWSSAFSLDTVLAVDRMR